MITFCGSKIDTFFDINSEESKFCFRQYENGFYKNGKQILTRHPNILKTVMIGKSGWGLWVSEWSQGIGEGCFTKREILEEFEKKGVKIPKPFMEDFENRIIKEILKKM